MFLDLLLAQLEGLERGPAGNTSLAAAFSLAQELDEDKIIVVQETEYTGAGKHIQPQLSFAKDNGVKVEVGNPEDEIPGENIILPKDPSYIKARDLDLNKIKKSYIKNCINNNESVEIKEKDLEFLANDTKSSVEFIKSVLDELNVKY